MRKHWRGLTIADHTCIIGECVPVAQLVERWSPKPQVGGSSPSRRATQVLAMRKK